MESVNLFTAFIFGLLSFISPCVLPIVPGYISFISGVSIDAMKSDSDKKKVRNVILFRVLSFILGFSIVFILLGASATAISQFLSKEVNLISKISGVLIIIFALNMIGEINFKIGSIIHFNWLFKIPFLSYEQRFHTSSKPLGTLGAFLVGFAFAFGWTPCIGPILAAILAIASQQEKIWEGISLLAVYSLGLGIPFFITGFSITLFYNLFNRIKKHMRKVEVGGGIMLLVIGVLIYFNQLAIIAGKITEWIPFLNEIG